MPDKKNWDFSKTIEEMPAYELAQRIEEAYATEMPVIQSVPYIGVKIEQVEYIYPELTALCPMTGIQDLYTIKIFFMPDKWIPELKSLRQYLLAYRDLPISHEHLASKIYMDLYKVLAPQKLRVTLYVAVRGGIKTTIHIGDKEQ